MDSEDGVASEHLQLTETLDQLPPLRVPQLVRDGSQTDSDDSSQPLSSRGEAAPAGAWVKPRDPAHHPGLAVGPGIQGPDAGNLL